MTEHSDTHATLYPGGRGTGKTTALIEQAAQATFVGQSVLIVTPTMQDSHRVSFDLHKYLDSWPTKVPCVSEVGLASARSRGLRLDHVFVDDADRFEDSPAELITHFHPGVPFTMTYTPTPDRVADMDYRAALREEFKKSAQERRRRDAEDDFMLAWMYWKIMGYNDD